MVLLHATAIFPLTLLLEPLGSRAMLPALLYFGMMIAAAILVVIVAGPKHLSRQLKKQEEGAEKPGGTAAAPAPRPA